MEDGEEEKQTLRIMVEKLVVAHSYAVIIDLAIFLQCSFSTMTYIVSTYLEDRL